MNRLGIWFFFYILNHVVWAYFVLAFVGRHLWSEVLIGFFKIKIISIDYCGTPPSEISMPFSS